MDNTSQSDIRISLEDKEPSWYSRTTRWFSLRSLSATKANLFGCSLGFISTGYQYNVISLLNVIWSIEYTQYYTQSVETRVNNALLYGVLVGQLLFGIIADYFGRKVSLLITSTLIILGAILATAAMGANNSIQGLFWALTIGRGLSGVGSGGEYPCCMPTNSEDGDALSVEKRGRRIALLGPCIEMVAENVVTIVQIILLHIFGTQSSQLEPTWRISIGLVIIPASIVFVFRLCMKNSRLYERDKSIRRRFPLIVVIRSFGWRLVGTCLTWFLMDSIYFSFLTFGADILANVTGSSLMHIAYYQLVNMAWIPMAYLAAFLIDRVGRKNILMFGFFTYAVTLFLIGGLYPLLYGKPAAYLVLYIFQGMFQILLVIPIYLIPSEVYPTVIRSTCYGISAAFGKVGGIVGVQFFLPIANAFSSSQSGYRADFLVAGGIAVVGLLVTYCCIPDWTKISLEKEDDLFWKSVDEYETKHNRPKSHCAETSE
ncbi:hypothetical protein GpartN1_g6927.t1 [Galdieria partita]|uniref:Major facilitator superfamily (MFS) profile domain-containing protein n=1 Tax=Galdieria partita TaxID=83374 RepID=A0A9C7Q4F1_9RHOD|nr:hypothetical protein GpartN1_g6927.t1 [Galdieria partita]